MAYTNDTSYGLSSYRIRRPAYESYGKELREIDRGCIIPFQRYNSSTVFFSDKPQPLHRYQYQHSLTTYRTPLTLKHKRKVPYQSLSKENYLSRSSLRLRRLSSGRLLLRWVIVL